MGLVCVFQRAVQKVTSRGRRRCAVSEMSVCGDSRTAVLFGQGFSQLPEPGECRTEDLKPRPRKGPASQKDWRRAAAPQHLALFLCDCKEVFRYPALPSLDLEKLKWILPVHGFRYKLRKLTNNDWGVLFHFHDKKKRFPQFSGATS